MFLLLRTIADLEQKENKFLELRKAIFEKKNVTVLAFFTRELIALYVLVLKKTILPLVCNLLLNVVLKKLL